MERLGHAQVEVASGLGVKSAAVTKMLGKLRREGVTKEEEQMLETILGELVSRGGRGNKKKKVRREKGPLSSPDPKVIILRRTR